MLSIKQPRFLSIFQGQRNSLSARSIILRVSHCFTWTAQVILDIVLSSPGTSLASLKASMTMPCPENMVGRLIGKGMWFLNRFNIEDKNVDLWQICTSYCRW